MISGDQALALARLLADALVLIAPAPAAQKLLDEATMRRANERAILVERAKFDLEDK